MAKAITKERHPNSAQLRMQIDDIFAQPVEPAAAPSPAPTEPEPEPEPLPTVYTDEPAIDRQPFGAWLVQQHQHKREWIASFAKMAKSDPRFPKAGTPDDVRDHLGKLGADGDAFEAIDDAETDWLALWRRGGLTACDDRHR